MLTEPLSQFFCCLLVILVAEVAAGVWAWQNRNEFNTMVESSVQHTVKDEYSIVHSRTVAFDAIQQHVSGSEGDSYPFIPLHIYI